MLVQAKGRTDPCLWLLRDNLRLRLLQNEVTRRLAPTGTGDAELRSFHDRADRMDAIRHAAAAVARIVGLVLNAAALELDLTLHRAVEKFWLNPVRAPHRNTLMGAVGEIERLHQIEIVAALWK